MPMICELPAFNPMICPEPNQPEGLNGVTELCPNANTPVGYFTEIIVNGNLVIPPQKPPKEHIVKITHHVRLTDVEVLYVTLPPVPGSTLPPEQGYKVVVAGVITLNIQYVAAVPDQKVHFVHYDLPFTAIVLEDCGALIPNNDPPTNHIVHVCVEKLCVEQIDSRTLSKQIVLMVWTEPRSFTP